MENNAANRKLVARIELESMSFQDMEQAIIYEFSERYKREPDLFETVVAELTEIEMLEGGE